MNGRAMIPFPSYRIALIAGLLMVPGPGHAQFAVDGGSGGAPGGGPGGGPPNFTDTKGTSALSYADVNFEVVRLVKDQNIDGFRLILSVTETKSPRRKAAFVQPQATLMDDMGNVYYLADSTGLRICGYRAGKWDESPGNCAGRSAEDLTQMASNITMPVAMAFVPADGSIAEATVELASSATLNAALVVVEDGSPFERVDIVIPGIPLP